MENKKILLNKFSDDPLYKYMWKASQTEEDLFPQSIIDMDVKKLYSTIDVAQIINRNDNDVRNLMKLLTKDKYIIDSRTGRNYKLNIFDVYKIFLANLFCSRKGFNYNDVRYALGLLQDVQKGVHTTPNDVTNDNSSESLLKAQIIKKLNEGIEFMNAKALDMQRNLTNVYECFQAILEIDQQMFKINHLIIELELEERTVYSQYFDLKHEISMLNNEFRNDLNQVKWNRLLAEMISDRKSFFKKQNDKFTTALCELMDRNVEERLAKSKDKATEKSVELVALEIKLATLKKDIEEKRNELIEQNALKERVLLASKKYFVLS